jgi:hypothetical protein
LPRHFACEASANPLPRSPAQTGATVFGIAFSLWIRDDETRSLAAIVSDVLEKLLNLTGAATLSPNAA